jgi:hypothetical protein
MITGRRERESGEEVEDVRWSPARAAVGLVVIVLIVWAVSKGFHLAGAGGV